jgi:hypothetical protein
VHVDLFRVTRRFHNTAFVVSVFGQAAVRFTGAVSAFEKATTCKFTTPTRAAIVNQHIAHVGTPAVSTIYELHKAIVGAVNNSPVRLAFASFEARWSKLYERKRRASDAKKPDATKPSADATKPKPNPT